MNLIAALLLALAQVAQGVAELSWLSGAWVERSDDGEWTEEYWTPPRGGMMIGAGMTGSGETLRHFEHMRIVSGRDRRIAFHAMPKGGPAVVFPLVRQSAGEAVFENPSNDYPQRVSYRLDGETLIATISQMDGSREARWTYRRPD